ncbi:MAG: hypothetical protein AABX98_05630, partial [Nanoarchaeota archaeon]
MSNMYNQIYQPLPIAASMGYQSPRVSYNSRPTDHTRTASIDSIVHATDSLLHSTASIQHYQSQSSEPTLQETKEVAQYTSSLAPLFGYSQTVETYFAQKQNKEYHAVDGFLKLYRPKTQFIDDAAEIESFVKETFEKTTGQEFPKNIVIRVLDKEDMKNVHEQHGAVWSDSIQGFSVNSHPIKQVFVKKTDLDKVMIVVGHEIGHVLSASLANAHDEEAKAFAFEFAWIETIMKHNIGNLKNNFTLDLKPANNGLHDVACSFVKALLQKGKGAIEVYG